MQIGSKLLIKGQFRSYNSYENEKNKHENGGHILRFHLMNKDTVWLLFESSCDEFNETVFSEKEWFTDLRPHGYTDLYSFLDGRKAPKHRKHIEKLLERYNCLDTEGFIRVTHALSLNDTLWIKEEDSTLSWKDISLYTNEFSNILFKKLKENM